MQPNVIVRQAVIAELEKALPLVERFFAEEGFDASPEQMREQLAGLIAGDDSTVFLAWLDDEAVGIATVTTTSGIELGLSAELEDLYVRPEVRGLGAGAALIKAVKDWCRARGCSLLVVVVTPESQAAHDLIGYYRRRGFRETGRTLLFAYLDDQDWPTLEEWTSLGQKRTEST